MITASVDITPRTCFTSPRSSFLSGGGSRMASSGGPPSLSKANADLRRSGTKMSSGELFRLNWGADPGLGLLPEVGLQALVGPEAQGQAGFAVA